MNIGDVRTEVPTIYMKCGLEVTGPQKCQVVYIHPEGRFYRVRFTAANGTHFHECYFQQAQASEQDQPFKHGFHAAHRPAKGGALAGGETAGAGALQNRRDNCWMAALGRMDD